MSKSSMTAGRYCLATFSLVFICLLSILSSHEYRAPDLPAVASTHSRSVTSTEVGSVKIQADGSQTTDFASLHLNTQKNMRQRMDDILAEESQTVTFLQIGAANGDYGDTNDPIQKMAFNHKNWRGVMMEPVPWLFEKLTKAAEKAHMAGDRVQLVNAALAQSGDPDLERGSKSFYRVNLQKLKAEKHVQGGMWDRLGSFFRSHIVKHLANAQFKTRIVSKNEAELFVQETQVTIKTAKDILEECGLSARSIDVFVVDTEGYDFIVISEFMGQSPAFRPRVVIYETIHLSSMDKKLAVQFMQDKGYFTMPQGINMLCVRR